MTIAPRRQRSQETSPIDAQELARAVARILHENHATDIAILDVSGPLVIADYFVIANARNPRHALAMASEVDFRMKRAGRLRRNAAGTEGESPWVLLDLDEVVVHVFQPEARSFYDLESLWADVPRVPFEPPRAPDDGEERAPRSRESFPDSMGTV